MLYTLAKAGSAWERVVSVLVDTGSEISLVRPGLLLEEDLRQAAEPIRLVTVSGRALEGGRRVADLTLELRPLRGTDVKRVGGVFYEAAIEWDLIVGYDFLIKNKMGLLPHKKGLVIEKGGDVTLFTGTNKAGGCVSTIGNGDPSCSGVEVQGVRGKSWVSVDYAVRDDLVKEVVAALGGGVPTVDAFASASNKRFDRFWSEADNAFDKDWGADGLLWDISPFGKISSVVSNIIRGKAKAILPVPEWWM